MHRQKRPFYIIGHNPNTLKEAKEFLDNGVNALEPDIVHAEGRYYVSHTPQPSYKDVLTVEAYLKDLKELVLTHRYNLALIIWDLKDTDFDPNHFLSIVKENFSGEPFDGVTMLMTHSDAHDFVCRYKGGDPNIGVGVDESDTPPPALEQIFKKNGQKNFSYADGITTFLTKPGVFQNIVQAQRCRFQNQPESFKLIYTWVLDQEASMRKYLDTYMDGIMVDAPAVKKLKGLVNSSPYNEVYELARNGYNPFAAPAFPKYLLTVKTKDKFLAGTDARVIFTLKSTSGSLLKSLPYDASLDGRLDRDSTSFITLEGMDLGEIHSLTVEALSGGIAAGWLPERITLESNLLDQKLDFVFNNSGSEEWITKKGGAVTIFPEQGGNAFL